MTKDKFTLGVGQAHEFEIAARSQGWTNKDLSRLIQDPEMLRCVLAVVRGQAKAESVGLMIDLDACPLIADGFSVVEPRMTGAFSLNPSKLALCLGEKQKGKDGIEGHELREELQNQPVLSADVLDFLLKNRHLIPEGWKGKLVFFWGTVYRNPESRLFVRCLFWGADEWRWDCRWLDRSWDSKSPAAISEP